MKKELKELFGLLAGAFIFGELLLNTVFKQAQAITQPPQVAPSISLSPTSTFPGGQVSVTGSGFSPNGIVNINFIDPNGILKTGVGNSVADSNGRFTKTVQIPSSANIGTGYIEAIDFNTFASARAPITITSTATIGLGGPAPSPIIQPTVQPQPISLGTPSPTPIIQPSATPSPIVQPTVTPTPAPQVSSITLSVSPSSGNPFGYFTFSGKVTDSSGRGVPKITVNGYYVGGSYTDVVFSIPETAADGTFQAVRTNFAPGTYKIYAAAITGFGPGGATNPIIAATSSPVTLTITPEALQVLNPIYRIVGPEPDGSYYVVALAGASGGTLPYDFKFYWSDGVVHDVDGNPVDTRKFPAYPSAIPQRVVVTDSAGRTASATLVKS